MTWLPAAPLAWGSTPGCSRRPWAGWQAARADDKGKGSAARSARPHECACAWRSRTAVRTAVRTATSELFGLDGGGRAAGARGGGGAAAPNIAHAEGAAAHAACTHAAGCGVVATSHGTVRDAWRSLRGACEGLVAIHEVRCPREPRLCAAPRRSSCAAEKLAPPATHAPLLQRAAAAMASPSGARAFATRRSSGQHALLLSAPLRACCLPPYGGARLVPDARDVPRVTTARPWLRTVQAHQQQQQRAARAQPLRLPRPRSARLRRCGASGATQRTPRRGWLLRQRRAAR
jgi:hypothetical protein